MALNFLGRLFGSDKALETAVTHVATGLDKLVYTKEERAEDAAKAVTEARSMLVEWFRNSQGQNLARRFLALMIAATWLGMYLLAAGLDIAIIWNAPVTVDGQMIPDPRLTASADSIGDRATQMNGAMMLILGFYFAAPHLSQIVGGAMNRFGKTE